ncbi:hypothetical protein PIB30_033199 [Stylosanthes scabra]|uniref:DUF4283 domain-containing protein n=1 Tax=Stylosanthes scabra TaxID=79078 RepID=A0ABU6RDA5_9FABA|nr:hypothetical protein [Stylosanthes scabra]
MASIWRNPEEFWVVEMKPKIYQFFFKKEIDMEGVLKGAPWLFRNAWMGLAEHYKTPKLGEKIATSMGDVIDCEVYESNRTQERFLKATVKMKIDTPFKEGMNLGNKKDGTTWVDFRFKSTPAIATLDVSSQREELVIAVKKGNQIQEPYVELESQEPEIFKNQKVEQQMIRMQMKEQKHTDDEEKGKNKPSKKWEENTIILQDDTNAERAVKNPIGRKWKRSTRETIPNTDRTTEERINQKRK